MLRVITLLAVVSISAAADAKQLVRQFQGNGNTTTASFSVESPWIIDWRLDGDYDSLVALDITLVVVFVLLALGVVAWGFFG